MMKRLRITAADLVMALLCGAFGVSAAEGASEAEVYSVLVEAGIIDEVNFSDDSIVCRVECVSAILICIGLTDDFVSSKRGADWYAFADTSPFSYCGYADYAKIAYGEKCVVDTPTYGSSHRNTAWDYLFFTDMAATVKEALAFMLRCLEDLSAENFDLTLEKAKEYSLISDEDAFAENIDEEITQGDFVLLLERFVQQKRYKYYLTWDEAKFEAKSTIGGSIDEERSVTYFEMLNARLAAAEELLSESEWESVKKFMGFEKGDLFADLAAEIDLPYEDIGSGIYIYLFTISDSSKVYVYSNNGKTIVGILLKVGENTYNLCE